MEHCDMEEAERVANGVRSAIADYRFQWEGKMYSVGVSIGIAAITEDTESIIEALKEADGACYTAKDRGRNCVHVFHEQDTVSAERNGEISWFSKINKALEDNRFHLDYQLIKPIDSVGSDKVLYEILLRMEDESGEIFLPDSFLRAAARYSLTTKLDQWVINTFFAWLENNPEQLSRAFLFSINLSGSSLADPEFLLFVHNALSQYAVPPGKICFELTETAIISDLASATHFIHTLTEVGCYFALDDFGTGMSSIGYLRSLPIEYLKISGVFVKNILADPTDLAMVKSMNDIGQVMGRKTIAKSIESTEILSELRQLGVNYAQGYVIGKPKRIC